MTRVNLILEAIVRALNHVAQHAGTYLLSTHYTIGLFGFFFVVVRPTWFWPWEGSNYRSRSTIVLMDRMDLKLRKHIRKIVLLSEISRGKADGWADRDGPTATGVSERI